ncbi:hypothetical protein DD237_001460 [Peronospora effusa]|uniref:Uncharacterized protein n=1 Tax=Peronospora effusa TaxID=542832 RepID=A0A3R7XYU0_9STRA|nr:hypothetical protein DD237_001460 [Peronospora effusa]
MDEALKVTSCVFQSDSDHKNRPILSLLDSLSSSTSDTDLNVFKHENDDNFGVDMVPRDQVSLESELLRLIALEEQLENETAVEFIQECDLLVATHEKQVIRAQAALERRRIAAFQVLEYAREKARETYARRCMDVQRDMNVDIERELRRLQTAKDGVSVTSRRRRTVRHETRGKCLMPVQASGNSMRRRRTMYTSDGDEEGPEDVFLASASPEERAQRVQFQEKKRLEQLLGSASVFEPVVEQVTAKEIAEDLKTIRSALMCREKHLKAREIKMDKKKHKIMLQKHEQNHELKKNYQKKQKAKRQRPMIITPRRIPHTSGPNLCATPSHRVMSTATKKTRPRLHYNPRMLQEGQEVEVFRRQRSEVAAGNAHDSQDECVMSGIITAATATQVYLLTASGRFESFDVRDCIQGLLYVRAVESNSSPTNCVRNDMNANSA